MNIIIENGITVIYPSGNWITDGDTFSDKVYLGINQPTSAWRDATDEEYEAYRLAEEEPTDSITLDEYNSAKQTVADYENQNLNSDIQNGTVLNGMPI